MPPSWNYHQPLYNHHRNSPSFRRRKFPHISSVNSTANFTVFLRRSLAFLIFAVTVFLIYDFSATDTSSTSSSFVFPRHDIVSSSQDNGEYRLERVLKSAATKDKTVILTTLNEAWAAPSLIIDLFLQSFTIGHQTQWLLNHLVIVALDDKAFRRCLSFHPYCVVLVTEGVDFSKEAYFMTPDYLKMMWRRIDFLRSVLEMGYNFVFTDTDIMWFRDPFPHFDPDADFQIACDHFTGDPFDVHNWPNGGFTYVKSSNRSIEFYKFWHSSKEKYPGYHDQDVLNFIKHSTYITEIGLKMRFLDTAFFGGFCEPSKDLNEVCTMHANCCLGLDNKLFDLSILLQDWRLFMSLPPSLKRAQRYTWRVPMKCRLDVSHSVNPPKESREPEYAI